ncbi:hypothetical protein ACMD2_09630 [Ananas comosus]|uniref:Uncharacterized protein n=2 Tax=Ananas comosus TaxID=4615 RepID=A0A199VM00_ANACO|nr:hypothetical protein ACMD2_09630 [Ananas comosus]CAD1824125.1 unnamed protein product [Ananas comosus var. bracteatus]
MEEYNEAEIVWPEDGDGDGDGGGDDYAAAPAAAERRRAAPSAPIRIARVGVSRSWGLGFGGGGDDDEEEEGDGGGEEAAPPPHVVAARRSAAASVCVGQGRTLKGRDLTHFRNSILRMTGFLEM